MTPNNFLTLQFLTNPFLCFSFVPVYHTKTQSSQGDVVECNSRLMGGTLASIPSFSPLVFFFFSFVVDDFPPTVWFPSGFLPNPPANSLGFCLLDFSHGCSGPFVIVPIPFFLVILWVFNLHFTTHEDGTIHQGYSYTFIIVNTFVIFVVSSFPEPPIPIIFFRPLFPYIGLFFNPESTWLLGFKYPFYPFFRGCPFSQAVSLSSAPAIVLSHHTALIPCSRLMYTTHSRLVTVL